MKCVVVLLLTSPLVVSHAAEPNGRQVDVVVVVGYHTINNEQIPVMKKSKNFPTEIGDIIPNPYIFGKHRGNAV